MIEIWRRETVSIPMESIEHQTLLSVDKGKRTTIVYGWFLNLFYTLVNTVVDLINSTTLGSSP